MKAIQLLELPLLRSSVAHKCNTYLDNVRFGCCQQSSSEVLEVFNAPNIGQDLALPLGLERVGRQALLPSVSLVRWCLYL